MCCHSWYNFIMENINIQKEEFINIISKERLNSYNTSPNDDFLILLKRYIYNIKFSEAFYSILSIFEVVLRNKIHNAIDTHIKSGWLLSELRSQSILLNNEYKILLDAANKARFKTKKLTKGAIISELSFGFWINLCKKAYKTVFWDKKNVFESVFPNFPMPKEMDKMKYLSSDLKTILQLRNRVFHHETITNHPLGVQNCYSTIEKLLFYMSKDFSNILVEISSFNDIIKQKP